MAKRLRYSRWRRLPGLYRISEKRPPSPNQDEQRLTLYLPWEVLDRAEALAARAGGATVQSFCERLLRRAIEEEDARARREEIQARLAPLEGLDALASDPELLAEWTAHPAPRPASAPGRTTATRSAEETEEDEPMPPSPAAEVVLRHAAPGRDDPDAFLPALRRGEAIAPAIAQELLRALADLEAEARDATRLDRKLAYALHRLAFEGQVLLTDAWPAAAADAATVDVLRVVQEAVDRVLSGEDIRYYAPGPGPEAAP